MTGLVDWFRRDHRECDSQWAEVEAAVEGGDANAVAEAWRRFEGSLLRHLEREERILFPAFEAATGMTQGPTHVMRSEHEQMRGVLAQMGSAVQRGDHQELIEQGDTLLLLIQQHNLKEEGVLYPMAERTLAAQWPTLQKQLAELGGDAPAPR